MAKYEGSKVDADNSYLWLHIFLTDTDWGVSVVILKGETGAAGENPLD